MLTAPLCATLYSALTTVVPFPFAGNADAAFTGWGVSSAAWGAITISGNGRAYLLKSSQHSEYESIDLREKTMTFTVDVSKVACSVNAALYLVSMTGSYCDIQSTPSCTELDVFEGNTHAVQATVHTERGQGGDGKCNQWGCTVQGRVSIPEPLGSDSSGSPLPFHSANPAEVLGSRPIITGQLGQCKLPQIKLQHTPCPLIPSSICLMRQIPRANCAPCTSFH